MDSLCQPVFLSEGDVPQFRWGVLLANHAPKLAGEIENVALLARTFNHQMFTFEASPPDRALLPAQHQAGPSRRGWSSASN
jgi:hypothetical protein